MFQTKVVEKIKTHILSCNLWDNVEKYDRARQATDDNIIRHMRSACTHSKYIVLLAFAWQ
jgi:hypothetical protein